MSALIAFPFTGCFLCLFQRVYISFIQNADLINLLGHRLKTMIACIYPKVAFSLKVEMRCHCWED